MKDIEEIEKIKKYSQKNVRFMYNSLYVFAQSAGAVEYTDCTSAGGG